MESSKNHPNHKSMEERLSCQTCQQTKAQIEADILKVNQGLKTPTQIKGSNKSKLTFEALNFINPELKKPSRAVSNNQSYEVLSQVEVQNNAYPCGNQNFTYTNAIVPVGGDKISVTPHKFFDGVRVCQSATCKVCNPKKEYRMEYRLDLPGTCKFCNDCNCCEGIDGVAFYG